MMALKDKLCLFDANKQPQRGDIILSHENTIFSKLVQWITGSEWSHVSIYVGTLLFINNRIWRIPDTDEEIQHVIELNEEVKIIKDCVIGAVPKRGVSFTKFFEIENKAIYRVRDMPSEDIKKVIYFALDKLDHPYDYLQCLLLFYRIFVDMLTVYEGDPNPDKFICSELVAKAFLSVGIEFGNIVDNVLPGTIASSSLVMRIK